MQFTGQGDIAQKPQQNALSGPQILFILKYRLSLCNRSMEKGLETCQKFVVFCLIVRYGYVTYLWLQLHCLHKLHLQLQLHVYCCMSNYHHGKWNCKTAFFLTARGAIVPGGTPRNVAMREAVKKLLDIIMFP